MFGSSLFAISKVVASGVSFTPHPSCARLPSGFVVSTIPFSRADCFELFCPVEDSIGFGSSWGADAPICVALCSRFAVSRSTCIKPIPTKPHTRKTMTALVQKPSEDNADHISAFPCIQIADIQKHKRAPWYSLNSSLSKANPTPTRIGTQNATSHSLNTVSESVYTRGSVLCGESTAKLVDLGGPGACRVGPG